MSRMLHWRTKQYFYRKCLQCLRTAAASASLRWYLSFFLGQKEAVEEEEEECWWWGRRKPEG